jgi:hypothetical protein
MKQWYLSRLVWSSILQSVIGLLTGLVLLLQQGLSGEAVASLSVGVKGLYDLYARLTTTQAITPVITPTV